MVAMRISTAFLGSLLVVAACGGNSLDPGAGNSLGSGSHTLLVHGSISAASDITNAGDGASFSTHVDLTLMKDQVAVTTGTVAVSSSAGDLTLTYATDNGGHWVGDQAGYDEVYELNVTSGGDTISGVRVDGPDIHTFTSPALGATVDSTMPLAIAWSRGDHADIAELSTQGDGGNHVTIDDTGSYSLAAGTLKSNKDQSQTSTINLRRTNQVVPAGAVAGSTLSVSVRNGVDVVAMPNPNA